MKVYTKEIDGRTVVKPKSKIVIVKDGMQTISPSEEMLLEDGWVEYVAPEPEETVEPIEETIEVAEEAVEPEVELTEEELEKQRLKNKLSCSDYKIIKCMEAYLCCNELPYDINELHAERDAYRQKIEELGQ